MYWFAVVLCSLMTTCRQQMVKTIDVRYLDTAVDLVAESFIPNGVFAVPDGPGPNLLS